MCWCLCSLLSGGEAVDVFSYGCVVVIGTDLVVVIGLCLGGRVFWCLCSLSNGEGVELVLLRVCGGDGDGDDRVRIRWS